MKINSISTVEDYKLLVESLTEGIMRVDINEKIVFVNKQFCKIVGYSKKELLGKIAHDFLLKDKNSIKAVKKAIRERKRGIKSKYNLQVITKSGKAKWINMNGTPLYDDKGKVVGSMGIVTDITDSLSAKEELAQSQERFEGLSNATFEAIGIHDNGIIVEVNQAMCDLFGYKRKEMVGQHITQFGPKEVTKLLFQKMRDGDESPYTSIGLRKDGTTFESEVCGKKIYYMGKKARVVAIRDISVRKKTEAALIESEAQLRELVEYLPHPIVIHEQGQVLYVNSATLKLFRLKSPKEIIGTSIFEFVHPDFHEIVKKRTQQTLSTGKPAPLMEQQFIRSDGSVITVEVTGTLINFENRTVQMATMNDITEKKAAERAREEEEVRFKSLFNNANDLIQSVTPQGNFLFVNNAWLKTLGYTRAESNQMNMVDIIHPSSLDHCTNIFSRVMKGERVENIEATFVTKKGESVEVNGSISSRRIGGLVATQGIFRNVTIDKKAQEKLARSEKRYRDLVEKMNEGIIQVDTGEVIEYVNKRFCQIVGFREKELIGNKAPDILLHDDESLVVIARQMELRRKGRSSKYEVRFKKKSGEWIWASMNGAPLTNEKGKIIGSMGIVTDITEQVHDKQALAESEERYRNLNETAFDAIVVANSSGNIISWNKGAEIIFKYGEKEIIGKPLTTIMPSEYENDHLKGFNRHLTTGKKKYIGQVIEMEGRRKSGEIFPIEINLSSWETKSGKYFSGIIRDISKRKQIEQRIIELNEELEVRVVKRTGELEKANDEIRALLKEMHHRVKNNLQIVSSLLNMQAATADDEKVARIFQDSQDRIQAMAFIHENLYLKESLSEISIKDYLEPLINDRIRANGDLRDKIKLRIKLPDVSFKIDTMLPIGLLINELVTNTLKHAYPTHKEGIIKLNLKIRKGNQAELNYSDDGVGFSIEKKRDDPSALGLVLIDSFVMQIDGEMELNSAEGGTHYRIKFEIPV